MAKSTPIRGTDGKFRGSVGAGASQTPKARTAPPRATSTASAKKAKKGKAKATSSDGIEGATPLERAIKRIQTAIHRLEMKEEKTEHGTAGVIYLPGSPYQVFTFEKDEPGQGVVVALLSWDFKGKEFMIKDEVASRDEATVWAVENILYRATERTSFNGRYQTDPRVARAARRTIIAKLGSSFRRDGMFSADKTDFTASYKNRVSRVVGTKKDGYRVTVTQDAQGKSVVVHDALFTNSRRAVDFAEEMALAGV